MGGDDTKDPMITASAKRREYKKYIIFCSVCLGWTTSHWTGLSNGMIGILGVLLMTMPKFGPLPWVRAQQQSWKLIIIFSGLISFGAAFHRVNTQKQSNNNIIAPSSPDTATHNTCSLPFSLSHSLFIYLPVSGRVSDCPSLLF